MRPAALPSPLTGVLLTLAAFAMFTGMDTVVKLLGGRYPVVQVLFMNSAFSLVTVVLIAAAQGRLSEVRPVRLRRHLLRWLISFGGTLAVFWCYPRMPLADVYAILFTAPLIITALSVPLLGERVGWRRWTAVLVGFLGVVVMLRPGTAGLRLEALVALVGALGFALNMIMVRKLTATETTLAIAFWGQILSFLGAGLLVMPLWIHPTLPDLGLAAIAGTIAGSGFLVLVRAYSCAPAALLAPFQYVQLLYGTAVGWLLFGDLPTVNLLLGAAIVIASGLYIVRREARLARAHRAGAP
jgi:drug/metabolite transporter (DMT)-like permease